VHCDHLIIGRAGAQADLTAALRDNREVYEFLARESGYCSLAEAEATLAERRRTR
jgi:hypothetical protein